jgi:hypothetical protein
MPFSCSVDNWGSYFIFVAFSVSNALWLCSTDRSSISSPFEVLGKAPLCIFVDLVLIFPADWLAVSVLNPKFESTRDIEFDGSLPCDALTAEAVLACMFTRGLDAHWVDACPGDLGAKPGELNRDIVADPPTGGRIRSGDLTLEMFCSELHLTNHMVIHATWQ